MRNMAAVLRENGHLYIHTHGPEMEHHGFPIDCYRFFREALIAFAELANLEILDILWSPKQCFAVYQKKDAHRERSRSSHALLESG